MVIAVAVVLVQRSRIKQRIEIDGVDAEIAEVIQFVQDALQIAAVTAIQNTVAIKVRPEFLFPFVARVPVAGPRGRPPIRAGADRKFERLASGIVLRSPLQKRSGKIW